jgi:4-amino-4-deoxy-L-arabinose transferase-like glycosyltransferase
MRILQSIDALRAALTDPARRERNVVLALVAYALLWALYGLIAKGSQGLHPDMTEVVAWSRDLSLGYPKHPPLAAWVVWLWFGVLPVAEWSYYVLAMLMPALTLWIVWQLSADYLDVEKRLASLALLTLVPFFNFHALKFNVNTVLMPAWAATTFWFLRSYRTRTASYAALAGLGAAACMLGKYWSIFLIAGLIVAALIDRRRLDDFRSPAPYVTALVGALALLPHLVWLVDNHFAPFGYAISAHAAEGSFAASALTALGYLAGSFGYVAAPVIIVFAVVRFDCKTLAEMALPPGDERRLVAAAFWAPLLLPAIAALVSGTKIVSLWSMSAWTLLPILLLSPPAMPWRAIDTRRLLTVVVALPLAALLASPVIAVIALRNGPNERWSQVQLLSSEAEREWHAATAAPLRFVGGDVDLAYGVAAYSSERPRALTGMPRPSDSELAKDGVVFLCMAEDDCASGARQQFPQLVQVRAAQVELRRDYLGFAGQPRRYTILILAGRK